VNPNNDDPTENVLAQSSAS